MENKIQLSSAELSRIELALQETITVLKNRFDDDARYVHPAKKYEELYDKITGWSDELPVSIYTLSAVRDDSTYVSINI